MCYQSVSRNHGEPPVEGSIRLSPFAANQLREALEQMELLLRTRHENAGLRHLVAMLTSLQTLGREIG